MGHSVNEDDGSVVSHVASGVKAAIELLPWDDRHDVVTRVALEVEALEPLDVRGRMVALGLVGAAATHRVADDIAHADVRRDALEAGAYVLAAAETGSISSDGTLQDLWAGIIAARGPREIVSSVSFAICGRLPLVLHDAAAIVEVVDPDTLATVGLGLGHAVRRGDSGALVLVREAWLHDEVDEAFGLGAVKGLGLGLFDDGLGWLADFAARAVDAHDEWSSVARLAVTLALQARSAHLDKLVIAGAAGLSADRDARRWLARLRLEANQEQRHRLSDVFVRWWHTFPPALRAALIGWVGGARLDMEELLRTERDPDVTAALIDAKLVSADDAPDGLQKRLVRLWRAHPVPEASHRIVTRLTGAVMDLGGGPQPTEGTMVPPSNVVALPAKAWVRTPLDALRSALWLGEVDEVYGAAKAVSDQNRRAAVEALFAATEVPNAALRRAVVTAIGGIGEPQDATRLVDVTRSYRALEGTVAAALESLDASQVAPSLADLYDRRLKWADDEAVEAYAKLSPDDLGEHLLRTLEVRYYPAARAGAARGLARHRIQVGVFALRRRGLSDTQETARLAALEALRALGGAVPTSDEIAGYSLLFKPADALDAAIERVVEAGTAALPGLKHTFASGSWRRRQCVCRVLARLPGADAGALLIDALKDEDEDVRMSAVEGLIRRGWQPTTDAERTWMAVAARHPLGQESLTYDAPALEHALRLGGHVFRTEVLVALKALDGWVPPNAEVAAWADAAALDATAATEHEGGADVVLQALDQTWQSNPHRARLGAAIGEWPTELIVSKLRDDRWGWRARVCLCHALGLQGRVLTLDAVEAVASQVNHHDDDVKRAALTTLAALGSEAAARAIARGFESPFQEDRERVAKALAAVGDAALPVVDELMNSTWWEERQGAALALRHWRRSRNDAADRLIVLAVDAEYRVSVPAREGLDAHGVAPTGAARRTALERAQSWTTDGLEWWFGLGLDSDTHVVPHLARIFAMTHVEHLPHRLGLIALFRAYELQGWLEEAARGAAFRHVSVRMAAADALRDLRATRA